MYSSIDLYCGAGGTTEGLRLALIALGIDPSQVKHLAVNHWKRAVLTHRHNHEWAMHRCARVDAIVPESIFSRPIDILIAGIECIYHSQARGPAPIKDQFRSTGFDVLNWISKMQPQQVLVENVPGFTSWGPLNEKRRPIKHLKGKIFDAFIQGIKAHGYRVEWKVLSCADYGDPTHRERFFLRAAINNGPITWPAATHGPLDRMGRPPVGLKPWRTARDIVDLANTGPSIFQQKLKPRPLQRIAAGLHRFAGDWADDFLALMGGLTRTVKPPASRKLPEPFILPHDQFVTRNKESLIDSLDRPLRTLTASNARCNFLVTPTVDRFGQLDICRRSLTFPELAAAQGFGPKYQFTGNAQEVERQIGAAVPVNTAQAFCQSALAA